MQEARIETAMSSIAISSIVFACVFGGAILGMSIRAVLPQQHLNADSKDVVKLGMGIVATLSALVLSLLIASAKGSYDAQSTELTQMSTKVILLDRVLAHYGPETKETRDLLRGSVARVLDQTWSRGRSSTSHLDAPSGGAEILVDKIQAFAPKDERRQATLAANSSDEHHFGSRTNTLVAICAGLGFDFHAVAGRAGFLAYHHLHQLRLVCPCQCHRVLWFARLRALDVCCDLVDPGVVHTLLGTDSDFQRPTT